MHDAAERARAQIEVPWDDVRGARVQRRALEAFRSGELPQDDEAPRSTDRRRGSFVRWWVAAAVVALTVGLSLLWMRDGTPAPEASAPPSGQSTLAFSDGSRSLLSRHAQVRVVEDSSDHVAVQQSAGRVHYEVAPRPERRFEVVARDVRVTVIGTGFDVEVEGDKVMIAVDHGRVRVTQGSRRVELGPGERVTIEGLHDGEQPAAREAAEPSDGPGPAEPASQQRVPSPDAQTSAAEWLRRADGARAAGKHEVAVAALRSLIAEHPHDRRVTHALFSIGQIERQRGNHAVAAQAFERCGNALQGDAVAEAASSWASAGNHDRARAAAERYLRDHPGGLHAERMRALSGTTGSE